MKRIFKKSLSLALSLALLFSVAPISFAENTAEAPGGTELASESEQAAETDQAAESEADTDSEQVTESEQSTEPKQGEASAEEKSESDAEASEEASPEASEKAAEESAPEALQEGESEPIAVPRTDVGKVEYPERPAGYTSFFMRKGGTEPGDLSISKNARATADERVWDMELILSGKNVGETTDIVLVIDRAKKMDYEGRLDKAKTEAKKIVAEALTEETVGHTKIAIVTFADNAQMLQPFSNDAELLTQTIDGISAEGGSHTQAGLYQAELLLTHLSKASHKAIVLLSNGNPTYGYNVKDGYKNYTEKFGGFASIKRQTTTGLPYELIDFYSSLGDGQYMVIWKEGWLTQYFVNHGNVAIVLANHIKEQKILLYAVGHSLPGEPARIMAGIGGKDYFDADKDPLDRLYHDIAGDIKFAANNAIVKDPIGPMFEIVDSNAIMVVDKNDKPIVGPKVTWKEPDTEHPSGHFVAELGMIGEPLSPIKIKYRVRIKDSAVPGEAYPTNGKTTVSYTDFKGKSQVKEFNVPLRGLKAPATKGYTVKHVLQDADGNYDSASAVTETFEGVIGAPTEAKAKTGMDGGIDYDYYTPLTIMQETIQADGSTKIEIRYARNYVTLTAKGDTKTYDGNEQTVEGYITNPAGESFDRISAGAKGTDAGEYTATFQEEKEKLEAKSGRKYFAKYETGKLIIEKADGLKDAFKLEINGYTGVYDGATHEPDIKGDLNELTVTHSVAKANDWKAGLPNIKDVSEQTYDIKFEHKNYLDFVAEEVLLKVTPKKASITAGSKSKVYDGIALTDNSFTTADFVTGEGVASAVIKGSIIDAGSVANVVESYELAVGTLATNYEIELINGTLTVTAKKVEDTGSDDRERHSIVTTDSDEKDTETIQDDQTPLARLNNQDHFAYLSGYPDGSFRPHDALTREQVAAIFFRLLDKEDREKIRSERNDFSDVEAHRWSNKHISTLSNGKIFSGYADGSFKPEQSVTRAELAVIASKFDKLETGAEHKFTDIKGHWAEKYIASAVKKGWINSYEDNTFRPEQNITRAEFVSFVNNVLNRHVKLEDILEHSAEFSDVTEKTAWYYCPIKCATNSYLFEESKSTENATVKFQKWTKLTTPIIEM